MITASMLALCVEPAPSTTTANAAPSAAACDIPKVIGDPKGFFKTLWITAPEIDRPKPAIIAVIILGNLICQIIIEVIASPPPNKAAKTIEKVLDEYYDYRGWEKTSGHPSLQTLERLGLP